MKVNRFELVKKFEMLLPVVGFNTMLPEYQRFRISNSTICASDGSMQMISFLPVDLGFSCAIPAQEFYGVLSTIKDEEVELTLDRETNKLLLKTGKVHASFASFPYKPLKDVAPVGTPWSVDKLGGIQPLLDKFAFCQSAISKDGTAGVFCGVLIDKEYIVASDKYRICRSKYLVDGKPLIDHVISIPVPFIDLMRKYADKIELLGLGDKNRKMYVIFKDGTLITTTLYSEGYFDTRACFPSGDFRILKITPEIFEAIEHNATFLKRLPVIDQDLTIQFQNHVCTISSELKEVANLQEVFDIEVDWDFTLFVNPAFFYDANQKMGSCASDAGSASVVRYFTEGGSIISIRGEDEYLITPRG